MLSAAKHLGRDPSLALRVTGGCSGTVKKICFPKTPQNRVLQIVTSANAHLVYTVIYVRIGKAILVIDCFIEDWEMDDEAGAPYRT
jgi:hypothetical protein